jgi:hypothetical protein
VSSSNVGLISASVSRSINQAIALARPVIIDQDSFWPIHCRPVVELGLKVKK